MKNSNRYAKAFEASRAGAKAKFDWIPETSHWNEVLNNAMLAMHSGDLRKAERKIRDVQGWLFNLDTRVRGKHSRPSAKAAFAHPLPASLERAFRDLDVQVSLLRRAFAENHLQGMREIGSWVVQAAQKVQSISESAADSAARVSPHSRTNAKSNGLTLAQRVAVEHDAKRMAAR